MNQRELDDIAPGWRVRARRGGSRGVVVAVDKGRFAAGVPHIRVEWDNGIARWHTACGARRWVVESHGGGHVDDLWMEAVNDNIGELLSLPRMVLCEDRSRLRKGCDCKGCTIWNKFMELHK